ncbi:MAG TPA: glycosyltransferase family A protein [Thiolinea sp.]|nr:glycosyltransferase family A protein [Thiolinea sp.]
MSFFKPRPKLSVIVNFYNMQREAERTLYSLSTAYQQNIEAADYEVLAIDNGSSQALNPASVKAFGKNFHYHYLQTGSASPSKALNQAARLAKGPLVMCCIDGARILSPNILSLSLQAAKLYTHPFIYTMSMHLGIKPQNLSIEEGYNQQIEDQLLATVNWQSNGYELFTISSTALSSSNGFFSTFAESNCFCLKKSDYLQMGGFDEAFSSKGGGLVNLDFFNRIHETERFSPILLLGEASFHQFHGGVATNVSFAEHPWEGMVREYEGIRNTSFKTSFKNPIYFGSIQDQARTFL